MQSHSIFAIKECETKYDEAIKSYQKGGRLQAARIMLDLEEKYHYSPARLWFNTEGISCLKELALSNDPYQKRAEDWKEKNIVNVDGCVIC